MLMLLTRKELFPKCYLPYSRDYTEIHIYIDIFNMSVCIYFWDCLLCTRLVYSNFLNMIYIISKKRQRNGMITNTYFLSTVTSFTITFDRGLL